MTIELQFHQNTSGTWIDLRQFKGIAAEGRNHCRHCECARPFFLLNALKAAHRPDGCEVWPPRELTVKPFCSACGWMYEKASISPELRAAVKSRDEGECVYCGGTEAQGAHLTCDHLVPESKGGPTDELNLATCCDRCNSTKGKGKGWKPKWGRFKVWGALREYERANLVHGHWIKATPEYLALRLSCARGGDGTGDGLGGLR